MAGDLKVQTEVTLKGFPMKEMGKDVATFLREVELVKQKWPLKKQQGGLGIDGVGKAVIFLAKSLESDLKEIEKTLN